MQRGKALLDVRTRPALLRAADKDTDSSLVHFIEQSLLFLVRLGVVDKGNLFFRDTALGELVLQIVIHVEVFSVFVILIRLFRRGQIAEDELRAADRGRFFIHLRRVVRTLVQLAAPLVFEERIETPHVERELLSVRRDLQHVVEVRIDTPAVYRFRALGDFLRDLHRLLARLQRDRDSLRFWNIQFDHIRRLYVRKTAV